ncbi:chemotaxis-specific protein-glutamate methyltransferase CheB [Geomonas sp. Red69]|uniref:chemotaxis-specific protein-glutamate methyltransferase CheB n=1 Tax=Geomonas diazotrophica TaxID=2843197 RepID=UPI001C10D554|nr:MULTISPECIES: chemotaxis-specific protein-glutamate methyltransferase CheB [Geomonas]MBU5637622.1 chemotaxis-specific protein-glutamate methyltransferase CheB [Geomonas diazotrophica]QXE88428.1 chemotaxis-specific protein-glutamate methyltransferase CheB [Geomonas nitrogeniifigens]
MIRLLVVEDSKTVQRALVAAFEADPEFKVIGTAETGEEAVEAARTLKPDLITMDINLPGMDGFDATRAIMSSCPVPIVIVTGKMNPKDSATLFRVMEAGALMVLSKPDPVGSPGYQASVDYLIHHLKLMAEIKVVRRIFPSGKTIPRTERPVPLPPVQPVKVVAIGASTGGPPLLRQILAELPERFPAAVLVVQHMAVGFTENFVHWLNRSSKLPVQLGTDGAQLIPGQVYVAPDHFHMEVTRSGRILLTDAAPEHGVRPSVSALFRSVAHCYGRQAMGVLLTGMGKDGALELKAIRGRGGITVAQDRESSMVFGMPGEAIEIDAAQHVLPPGGIIELLHRVTSKGASAVSS